MKTINNKKNLGKISCITMVAMTCVGLTGCGTKAEDVMKPLKDGKYEEAASKYNEAEWLIKKKKNLRNR